MRCELAGLQRRNGQQLFTVNNTLRIVGVIGDPHPIPVEEDIDASGMIEPAFCPLYLNFENVLAILTAFGFLVVKDCEWRGAVLALPRNSIGDLDAQFVIARIEV